MGTPLKLLSKGAAPSMLDTATANEVITKINALLGTIVSPAGFGKFVIGEKDVKLDLGPLAQIITNLQKSNDTITGTTASGSGGGGGGPTGPYPFDISFSGGPDPKDATVRPGTINGILASNFTDTYSLSASGVYYLVLSVTATDGEIVSALLSMPTSPPAGVPTLQGQPPTSFDYLLGVVVDLVWYRVIGNGSLTAEGDEVFRVSKVAPAPGTLPYDIYYNWLIYV